MVIPFSYKGSDWRFSEGALWVKQGGCTYNTPCNYGFITKAGLVFINLKYEGAKRFSKGLAPVKSGGKWGFINKEGKEYNKQFFVGPSIIGAYASLLTKQPNKIAQQALTDCEILVANYSDLEKLYETHHDLERLGRKIAESEQAKIPYALIIGDREQESETVSIRQHTKGDIGSNTITEVMELFAKLNVPQGEREV